MLLPPILGQVKEAFGVTYTEVGAGDHRVQRGLGAAADAGWLPGRPHRRARNANRRADPERRRHPAAALLPGYWFFIIAYGLMGVANTVYHPADYSILSAAIDGKKIGKAFSIHTFAGYLGFGVTPAMVLGTPRSGAGTAPSCSPPASTFAVAILLIVAGSVLPRAVHKPPDPPRALVEGAAKVGLDLLLSPPVLRNLLFFFCLAMANGGIQTFTVVGMARSRHVRFGGRCGAVGIPAVQRRRRAAGRHHRRPHAAP